MHSTAPVTVALSLDDYSIQGHECDARHRLAFSTIRGIVNMRSRRSGSIGWLATLVGVLTACKPVDRVPLSGNINLEYVNTSHSRDGVAFTLANGTNRSIYFRGDPDPVNVNMQCIKSNTADGFFHGLSDPPPDQSDIEVVPGERLHLNFYVELQPDFEDPQRHCRLELTLEDGRVITSPEFTPRHS